MDSLDFLNHRRKGDASLTVLYKDGTMAHIHDLDLEAFEAASPLLAFAFEESRAGPKHYLEDVTPASLASLLRYIHSDPREYVPEQCKLEPISTLLHAQVYRLADIYDIPGLQTMAKANMTRECEFSCSTNQSPRDLCEAIGFIYQHLPKHADIIETLANYCVSMFLYHGLGEIEAFRAMAYEHRRFQQDLCMVNLRRGFMDDAALGIIQLPIKPFDDLQKHILEGRILGDVLYDMWSIADETNIRSVGFNEQHKVPPSNSPELRKQIFASSRSGEGHELTKPVSIPYRPAPRIQPADKEVHQQTKPPASLLEMSDSATFNMFNNMELLPVRSAHQAAGVNSKNPAQAAQSATRNKPIQPKDEEAYWKTGPVLPVAEMSHLNKLDSFGNSIRRAANVNSGHPTQPAQSTDQETYWQTGPVVPVMESSRPTKFDRYGNMMRQAEKVDGGFIDHDELMVRLGEIITTPGSPSYVLPTAPMRRRKEMEMIMSKPKAPVWQEGQSEVVKPLVSRRKRSVDMVAKGLWFEPFAKRVDTEQQDTLPLLLPNTAQNTLVEEQMTEKSDDDDGFVHVAPDSDSDWTVV